MRYRELTEEQRADLIRRCVAELSYLRFGTRDPFYLTDGQMRREVAMVLEAADAYMKLHEKTASSISRTAPASFRRG